MITAAVRDSVLVAGRDLRLFWRTPEVVIFAIVQPALVVIMFRYVFAGAVMVPGEDYADFLLPGIFAQTVLFGAVGSGVGLAEDLRTGVIDRLRSLPIARSAVLGGRALAELARTTVVVVLTSGLIMIVGFRPPGDPLRLALTLVVLMAYAFALSWVFNVVGLYASSGQGAEAVGFPLIIPLAFASSAFVPVATMPDWLQAFAAHQPVTAAVDATRSLLLDQPAAGPVVTSLLWSLGVLAIFVPLAIARYSRLP